MKESKYPIVLVSLFLACFWAYPVWADTLTVGIAASSDDARETISDGVCKIDSKSLDLGVNADPTKGAQYVSFRFNTLNIPQGATISAAYIQFTCYSNTSGSSDLTIKAEAADNAATFTTDANNISSRSTTTASALWNPPDWPTIGANGADQKTPDLTTVVQEVVNRGGWASGNSMVFIISGTGTRIACSYDSITITGVASLYIEWTAGAPGSHTITASAGANGSIVPSGAVSVADGASQSFTITADGGYHIADVLVDSVSVGAVGSYDFVNVTGDHTISASFAADGSHTITASAGANGSIVPSGAVSVADGASQSFTITADGGYHVADVLVDGGSVGAVGSYDFVTVTSDHTISASFAADGEPSNVTHGVPPSWLESQGLSTNDLAATENDDPDQDGSPTWKEYYAGTDPQNSNSTFKITAFASANGPTISWFGSANNGVSTPFHMYRTTNLLSGTWEDVDPGIARGGSTDNSWSDPSPLSDQTVYYVVGVSTN